MTLLSHLNYTFVLLVILCSCHETQTQEPTIKQIENKDLADLTAINQVGDEAKSDTIYYRIENAVLILTTIPTHGAPFPRNPVIIEKKDSFYVASINRGFLAAHTLNMGDLAYPLLHGVHYQIIDGVLHHSLFNHTFVINQNHFQCIDTTFVYVENDVTLHTGEKVSPYRVGENGIVFSPFEKISAPSTALDVLQNTHLQFQLINNEIPLSNAAYRGTIKYVHQPQSTYNANYAPSNFVFIQK